MSKTIKFVTINVLAFFLLTIPVSGKPNQTSDKNKQSSDQKDKTSVALEHNNGTETHSEKADNSPPKWYTPLKRSEWWLVIVGFLTLVFVAWQAYETKLAVQGAADSVDAVNRQAAVMEKQANEMQEQRRVMQGQLDIMKGQLEFDHRPWIAVNVEPSSPIVFDQRGCVFTCNVTMTNVGHSVAKHVSLWIDFALLGIENPKEVRDRLCNIMKNPENKGSDYGWLLFPNQKTIEDRPVIVSPERVKKALDNKTFQGLNAIGLHLVGCVDYPSPVDDKKRYQTRFEYLVLFADKTTAANPTRPFYPSPAPLSPPILTPTIPR